MAKSRRLYLVPILSKALDIIEFFNEGESHTAASIRHHTDFSSATVYRMLKTLVHRGYLTIPTSALFSFH